MSKPRLHLCALGIALALSVPALGEASSQNPYHRSWSCQAAQGKWVCHEQQDTRYSLYNPHLTHQEHQAALSRALGWVPSNSDSKNSCAVCGGAYHETKFNPATANLALGKAPSHIQFGKSSYQLQGQYKFSDGVFVEQPNRTLYANEASITPNLKTGKLQRIQASGDIQLRQPGKLILAKYLRANINDHHTYAKDVTYLVKVDPHLTRSTLGPEDHNFTGYARGKSDTIEQLSKNLFVLRNASYTTCPPTSSSWELDASKMTLNNTTGRGHAQNVTLKSHGIPFFYFPYFSFPINDKRQSGFLYGTVGQTGNTGVSLQTPYYFNLAPNYDDTFTPAFYTKRGVVFGNEFRYLNSPNWLTQSNQGSVYVNYMPVDNGHDPDNHVYATAKDKAVFSPHWTGGWDVAYVSDKSFMDDFISNASITGANTTLLNQQGHVQYQSDHWYFQALAQQYQVVDKTLTVANRPYKRLPELDLDVSYPKLLSPLSLHTQMQFVDFLKTPDQGITPVEGQRTMIDPDISLPLVASYGYIKPEVRVNNTLYNLQNVRQATPDTSFPDTRVTRTIPIYDIDGALTLERGFTYDDKSYKQTLTPRLFYLYIPYVNQNNIPVFDSSVINFDYNQLFAINRFSGWDRIGDTNQLTTAVNSSIYNDNGRDIMDGGIGEIFYFHNRRVTLCRSAGCINNENPNHNSSHSDIAALFNYHIDLNWVFHTDVAYNPHNANFDIQNYQVQYQPDAHHILNFGYQTNASDYSLLSNEQILDGVKAPRLNQITTSVYWGITPTISLLGYWNYSLNAKRTLDIFGGFEYNTCCWAIRVLVRSYIDNSNPNIPQTLTGRSNTETMLQFVLKGLGSTDTSGIDQMMQQIRGYGSKQAGSIG